MASDALWINAATGAPEYNANELRQAMALPLQYDGRAMGAREGVRPGGDELFTSIAGSTITVKAGHAVIDPALTTTQGPYWVAIPTDEQHTLTAADPTNPRKDITICRVYDDDEDSSGNRFAQTEYLVGTPNPSPVEPSVPPGAIRLATIDVPAQGGGSPVVTDRRVSYLAGPEVQVFFANGSFTKASYPWMRRVRARVQAAGGAGGGAPATAAGEGAEGSGGSGGGYAEAWIDVWDLADSETVTVGTGGAGVSGANGNAGGNSSFGAHCSADGGPGGLVGIATSGTNAVAGANGGAGTVGDFGLVGGDGGIGRVIGGVPVQIAYGGDSVLGGSTRVNALASNDGTSGSLRGGGGSGAHNAASQTAKTGGAGANGIVIVEIY